MTTTVRSRPVEYEAFQIKNDDCAGWPVWAMDAWTKGLTRPNAFGALHGSRPGRLLLTVPHYDVGESKGVEFEEVPIGDWLLFRGWNDSRYRPIERLTTEQFERLYVRVVEGKAAPGMRNWSEAILFACPNCHAPMKFRGATP